MFPLQYFLHGKREIYLLFKIKMRSDLEFWNFKICARFNGHSAFQFVYRCVIGNLSIMSILYYKCSRIFTLAKVLWTYWLYWVFVYYTSNSAPVILIYHDLIYKPRKIQWLGPVIDIHIIMIVLQWSSHSNKDNAVVLVVLL